MLGLLWQVLPRRFAQQVQSNQPVLWALRWTGSFAPEFMICRDFSFFVLFDFY
jgi:hypothetical protein